MNSPNDGPRRLGKNLGGYFGERIDIAGLLREMRELATLHGWSVEEMALPGDRSLIALKRAPARAERNVYLSAGIHGDEPAGPLAMRQMLAENQWPENAAIWLCPCLNPDGYERGTRENAAGIDLNRDYRAPQSAEIRAHVRWLDAQPRFDVALCLHEDWESHGFYVYERNREKRPPLAPAIIDAVSKVCPIDYSTLIEGREALRGIIQVDDDPEGRELWPETVYLTRGKAAQSCTLEAPSDFSTSVRVAALVAAVRAVIF